MKLQKLVKNVLKVDYFYFKNSLKCGNPISSDYTMVTLKLPQQKVFCILTFLFLLLCWPQI